MKRSLTGLLLFAFTQVAMAYNFHLNQMEFNSWPEYCKAKYVITNIGSASEFANQVSEATISKWSHLLGDTWPNVHHGCAGLIWIVRAERLAGKNQQQYEFALREAANEAQFSIQRTNPSDPLYSKFVAVHARVAYAVGKKDQALQVLRLTIKKAPQVADSYAVLATFLFKEGKYDEARDVLQAGLARAKPVTAELHYFLGLVLLKKNDYEQAEKHAKAAYAQGYPLPGLRNKLKAAGHWTQ